MLSHANTTERGPDGWTVTESYRLGPEWCDYCRQTGMTRWGFHCTCWDGVHRKVVDGLNEQENAK